MNTLTTTAATLLAIASLSAQDPIVPPSQTPGQEGATKTPGAEEVVKEPTPQERVEKLEAEKAKLQQELGKIREVEKAGGLAARVKNFLEERQLTARSIMDTAPPPPAGDDAPSGARLLGDAEKADLPPDVIFVVDGIPVTEAEFDAAYAYLTSYPREQSEAQLKEQAVFELVRMKAAQAAFPKTRAAAKAEIHRIAAELADGDFAEIAKEHSDCPSAAQGGDLGYFGRIGMDFSFTRAAFGLKVGETSDVVPSSFGYHLIKVTGREKGEAPAQDRVKASHILALYTPDQSKLREVSRRVAQGQVDLAFVDDDYRAYTPEPFK